MSSKDDENAFERMVTEAQTPNLSQTCDTNMVPVTEA
ncbi:unnamed protein product [Rhodiola kirilowii]